MGTRGSFGERAVVAGVLTKYVNLAKGWRDRLFVLADDKLVYYKLSGKLAVDVQSVLDHHDPTNTYLRLIGAKIFVMLKDKKSGKKVPKEGQATPAGVYDLLRAKLRASGTESHKFYVVQSPRNHCTLQAETPDDRAAWLSALSANKVEHSARGTDFEGLTVSNGMSAPLAPHLPGATAALPPSAANRADALLAELQKEGLSSAACERVRAELAEVQRGMADALVRLAERDAHVQQLLDERRQLQTQLVAGSQLLDELPASLNTSRATSSSHVGDEGDEADGEAASLAGSVRRGAAQGRDVFFDAMETLSRRSSALDAALGPEPAPAPAPRLATEVGQATQRKLPEPEWLAAAPRVPRRTALPKPAETQKSVSLWAIIKEAIGKDLTRICLPVYFNEPLSALQKMAEEFEYSALLERAAIEAKGSPERMAILAVFAISGYAGTGDRPCKPFNPLLHETYELVDADRGFRMLTEKVIHHPTVLAGRAEGRGWTMEADLEVRSKFWGRCIELKPLARIELTFHDGERFTWNKVTTTINNLILGKIYVEHGGVMRVRSSSAPQREMRVKFKDGGLLTRGTRQVSGAMYENGSELPRFRLEGSWDSEVKLDLGRGPEVIWEVAPPPPDSTRYNFSRFALQLNEVTPGLRERLPPTDCRLRPDQAALEAGYFDRANEEKQRLEKKQRKARKEADEGVPLKPRWFLPVPDARRGEELSFQYHGGYWEQREEGCFTDCRDIFGE